MNQNKVRAIQFSIFNPFLANQGGRCGFLTAPVR